MWLYTHTCSYIWGCFQNTVSTTMQVNTFIWKSSKQVSLIIIIWGQHFLGEVLIENSLIWKKNITFFSLKTVTTMWKSIMSTWLSPLQLIWNEHCFIVLPWHSLNGPCSRVSSKHKILVKRLWTILKGFAV